MTRLDGSVLFLKIKGIFSKLWTMFSLHADGKPITICNLGCVAAQGLAFPGDYIRTQ